MLEEASFSSIARRQGLGSHSEARIQVGISNAPMAGVAWRGRQWGRLVGALIKQTLQIADRRLGANSEMGNQGLWRALTASLKGCNRLLVKKGLWRKRAPQSEGGFQSQHHGGGTEGSEQRQILALHNTRTGSIFIQLCCSNERKTK